MNPLCTQHNFISQNSVIRLCTVCICVCFSDFVVGIVLIVDWLNCECTMTEAIKLNGNDGQLDFRLRGDIEWDGQLDNFVLKIMFFLDSKWLLNRRLLELQITFSIFGCLPSCFIVFNSCMPWRMKTLSNFKLHKNVHFYLGTILPHHLSSFMCYVVVEAFRFLVYWLVSYLQINIGLHLSTAGDRCSCNIC